VNRYTFVVQVHPEGISTLENLNTHERVRLEEMSAVGPQIERWLDELGLSPPRASTAPAPSESAPGSAP
jgi:hypothetical protein